MAELRVHPERILENVHKLNDFLGEHDVRWTLVAKLLGGDRDVLESLLFDDALDRVHSIADARVSGLRTIKEIRPEIRTMYLKPPAVNLADHVVRYADVSLNTSRTTIRALNRAAGKQGKVHQVIVMIEMGELREGVIRDKVLDFYAEIFDLPHIEVIGIGTNLGCMYGVEPNYDKLIQLCLYKQLIEARFDHPLPLVSGSSSISLPLIGTARWPAGINHLRIGEGAFFGTSPLDGEAFRDLSTNTFDFSANIIETATKDTLPDGVINDAAIGQVATPEDDAETQAQRCIVDFGLMDVDVDNIEPLDADVAFAGTTSDMTVYDVTRSIKRYRVGNELLFKPNYMAVARLMHSKYISKTIVKPESKENQEMRLAALAV